MKSNTEKTKRGFFDRMVVGIERIGHKIPDPLTIFIILTVVTLIASLFVNGLVLMVPGTGTEVVMHSLWNREFFDTFVKGILKNYVTYTPIQYVMIILFGTSVCTQTDFFEVIMKRMLRNVSNTMMTLIIIVLSINGNIVGDGIYAFLPALAGLLYMSKGRNPILGIVTSYATIASAFNACLIITNADAVLAATTAEAAALLNYDVSGINASMTYYWTAISSILLIPVVWFASEKILAPILEKDEFRLDATATMDEAKNETLLSDLTSLQKKGLRNAAIAEIAFIVIILALLLPSNGILRNAETGSILNGSPFMGGITFWIALMFFIPGLAYGISSKQIKNDKDVSRMMSNSLKSMAPFLVMCFGGSIFNTCFNYTNLASLIAIKGAELMENLSLTGIPLAILIVIIVAILNFFMPHTTAKWLILAPVMVPMCILLGFSPAFTTCLYKIGNSVTNCMTPLSSGMIIALGEMQRYRKDSSLGTIIAMNTPFTAVNTLFWTVTTIVFFLLRLPVGPGAGIFA